MGVGFTLEAAARNNSRGAKEIRYTKLYTTIKGHFNESN
jgi:hypothetical protein